MLSHEKRCGVLVLISVSAVVALLCCGPTEAGDNYWSPAPLTWVNEHQEQELV